MSLALVPTTTTEPEFLAVFSRLCVALRETQDETGMTQTVYWEALGDLPIEALEMGASALMRDRGRRFFPTTAEWRAASEQAQAARVLEAVRVPRERPWTHECSRCEDTGWRVNLSCDGGMETWPEQTAPHTDIGPKPGTRHHQPWSYRADPRDEDTPRAAACGRTTPHLPHVYTDACPCRSTNRTYRRHLMTGGGAA